MTVHSHILAQDWQTHHHCHRIHHGNNILNSTIVYGSSETNCMHARPSTYRCPKHYNDRM